MVRSEPRSRLNGSPGPARCEPEGVAERSRIWACGPRGCRGHRSILARPRPHDWGPARWTGAVAVTVIANDRRHHSIRRRRGVLRRAQLCAGRVAHTARLVQRLPLRRVDSSLGCRARTGVERPRHSRCRAATSRRRRFERMWLARCPHDSGRRDVAQRLLPRHARGARRTCRSCGRVRRLRGPCGAATGTGAPGAGDQHVQRIQQLGRQEPVHRRLARVVRPTVRTGDVDAPVD